MSEKEDLKFFFDECPCRKETESRKWMKYSGKEVIPAWIADMDFCSYDKIIDALIARAKHGVFGYADPKPSVVAAVQAHLKEIHNWNVDKESIVFTPTLIPAITASIRAFTTNQEGVCTLKPVYPPLLFSPERWNRRSVHLDIISDGDRWKFDVDGLEKLVKSNPDVRLILLCNPYNPYGLVLRKDELESIADIAKRYNLMICSDEIHCDIVLDKNLKHIPIATISEDAANRTVTLMAASKTFNIAGLSCGFAIVPNAEMRRRFCDALLGAAGDVNLFGLTATEAAFKYGEPWRQACISYLRENLDYLESELKKIPNIEMKMRPEASFLAWLDVRALKLDDPIKAFECAGVGLEDGQIFGAEKGFLRLNFGCPRKYLEKIVNCIKKVALAN